MTEVGSDAGVERRPVCLRWQQRVLVTRDVPGEADTVMWVDVVGERVTFSCECAGAGCPLEPLPRGAVPRD